MLPPLHRGELAEVAAIHSAAGLLGSGGGLPDGPPYRAPHHTATLAAILGGGRAAIRPGAASLAHRGVLFLGDAPEFGRDVLAALAQPLRDGEVTIARGGTVTRFPARLILVAGMTPCPCRGPEGCACTPLQGRRYRGRLSRDLGSCIDLWLDVPAAERAGQAAGDPETASAARVAEARDRAARRLAGMPWQVNADIPGAELRRSYQPPAEALAAIRRSADLGEISVRTAHRVIRVAWTLADLAGSGRAGAEHCGQALAYWLGVAR
jgi:magnesium chelatase family protein